MTEPAFTADPVRWGFIGAGHIASKALGPAVRASYNAVLSAVGARDIARAQHLGETFGPASARPVSAYGSYDAVLRRPHRRGRLHLPRQRRAPAVVRGGRSRPASTSCARSRWRRRRPRSTGSWPPPRPRPDATWSRPRGTAGTRGSAWRSGCSPTGPSARSATSRPCSPSTASRPATTGSTRRAAAARSTTSGTTRCRAPCWAFGADAVRGGGQAGRRADRGRPHHRRSAVLRRRRRRDPRVHRRDRRGRR